MPDTRLNPLADGSVLQQDVVGGAGPAEVWNDNSDATYTQAGPQSDGNFASSVTLDPLPVEVTGHRIHRLTVYFRAKRQSGSPVFIQEGETQGIYANIYCLLIVGGVTVVTNWHLDAAESGPVWVASVFLTGPTGEAWTEDDFDDLEIGLEIDHSLEDPENYHDNVFRFYELYAVVTSSPPSTGTEVSREVLTRLVREQSGPRRGMEFTGRLHYLDQEIADFIDVSDLDGESASEGGWGNRPWERRLHEVQAVELDLEEMKVKLLMQDARHRLVTYFDSGRASQAGATDYPGVGMLEPGVIRSFTRNGAAWIEDVDGVIRPAGTGVRAFSADGEVLEGASTCWFARCAFQEGTASITLNGTGSGGSAIAMDATETWFDLTHLTYGSLKLTASSSPASDLEAVWPVTSTILANTIGKVSIRHLDDTADALSWWLRRGIDSKYWRESDQTWQAVKTWNPLPIVAEKTRHVSQNINVGASNTTLTLGVGVPSASAVASQINHVYKVQGEGQRWASSDIVCGSIGESRASATLALENNVDNRVMNAEQGSWSTTWTPYFSSADVPTDKIFMLKHVSYSNGNYQSLYYTNGAFVLHRHVGSSDYLTTLTAALTNREPVNVVARWSGADAAFGTAYGLTLLVDGDESDTVASVALVEADDADLVFADAGAYPDGAIADTTGWFFPLTIEEAGRLPL